MIILAFLVSAWKAITDDVFWYESPDLATRLTLIHEEGRTSRCLRVLTDERG
jgi:hypothetical protein